MPAKDRRAHDAAMAARMKMEGVRRTSGNCAICIQLVPLDKMQGHIERTCPGPRRKGNRFKRAA